MTTLQAALDYLSRGFSVIPVQSKGKHPTVAWDEFQHRFPIHDEIEHWFDPVRAGNLGIVTGSISNLVVVDLDTNEAKNYLKNLMGHNQVMGVPRVRTGRGWQLFFRHPGQPLPNSASKIFPDLDIRGDGGFVVAPPSIHPNGREYKWEVPLGEGGLPPLPDALVQLKTNPVASSLGGSSLFDTANALAGVEEGKRDDTLFRLACKLRGADVPQAVAEKLLVESAQNCTPPYPERAALEKVRRAYAQYAPREEKSFDRATPKPTYWPELVTIKSVIEAPEGPKVDYIWADTLPTTAASLLVAPPKTGKTNLAVNLSIAVARGVSFLDRPTAQGKVGYIFNDGGQNEIAEVFAKFGVRGDDSILLHAGSVPDRSSEWLLDMVDRGGLSLVVIDTLQRFFRFKDLNGYSEVTNTMEPLLNGMAERHCHVMFVHHAKKDTSDKLNASVGSTALRGLCYTFIYYCRLPDSEQRMMFTDQRSGKNMKETNIDFDWKTGWLVTASNMVNEALNVFGGRVVN